MEVLKKVLNIVIDIFIVLVVIISATIAVISLSSRKDGVAEFLGYVPFAVQTDSMSPAFEAGDLIVAKRTDVTDKDRDYEFKEGDVITYWMSLTDDSGKEVSVLNTHRIVKVFRDSSGVGFDEYETKGDNNLINDKEHVRKTSVVAIWSSGNESGIRFSKLGSVLDFLRKPTGFFVAVVLPMIAFFIYELVRFIMNFRVYNQEKQKEAALAAAKELMGDSSSDSSGLSEEQKAQAILDYLEKQKAEQEAAPPAAPEASEAEDSAQEEETEQPASSETEAVTEPEQETAVSEPTED